MSSTPKAVIFGSYINALSLIRALGRKNIPIIVVDHHRLIGSHSRYVTEFALAPDPSKNGAQFFDFLLSKASQWDGAILIPTDDFQVDILSRYYEQLSKHYVVAVPNRRAVQTVIDKKLAHELASRLGIPTPGTYFPKSPEHIREIAGTIKYPCILKPIQGHEFKKQHSGKLIEIDSPAKLCSEYAKVYMQSPLMVQEIIQGNDSNIMLYAAYYDLSHEPLAEFTGQKIRQSPPSFGNARVARSMLNSEVTTFSRALLKGLDFGGSLVGVEFKYDDRDGKLKFIEINARSVMWYSLIEASGMNLPWIMYQDRVLGKTTRQASHNTDIYWINETADFRAIMLRPKHERWDLKEYVVPYISKRTSGVFATDDWKPALRDWYLLGSSFVRMPIRLFLLLKKRTGR